MKAGKGHPNTNQANLVVGDWHWFLSHNVHYLGRVNVETGAVEYLELPAQLMPSPRSRRIGRAAVGNRNPNNQPLNASGFAVGDKGHDRQRLGAHFRRQSDPDRTLSVSSRRDRNRLRDRHQAEHLTPESLVAVNDLGPGGETWTLASLTFAKGRLYAHTMKEIVCIGTATQ